MTMGGQISIGKHYRSFRKLGAPSNLQALKHSRSAHLIFLNFADSQICTKISAGENQGKQRKQIRHIKHGKRKEHIF